MSPHIFISPYPHLQVSSIGPANLIYSLSCRSDPFHTISRAIPSVVNSGRDDSCAPAPFRHTAAFHSLTPHFISVPHNRSMAHPSAICRPFPTELHNGRTNCPGYHNRYFFTATGRPFPAAAARSDICGSDMHSLSYPLCATPLKEAYNCGAGILAALARLWTAASPSLLLPYVIPSLVTYGLQH